MFKALWNKLSGSLDLVLILCIFQILLDFVIAEDFVKPYDCSPEFAVVNIHPSFDRSIKTHWFYNWKKKKRGVLMFYVGICQTNMYVILYDCILSLYVRIYC